MLPCWQSWRRLTVMEMSSRKATQCFVVELGFHGRAATASLDCGSKSELKGKGQLLFSVLRSCLTMPSAYVFRHATDFVFDCFTWEMKYNYYVKILKLLPVRFPSLKIPKYINIKTFHFTNLNAGHKMSPTSVYPAHQLSTLHICYPT